MKGMFNLNKIIDKIGSENCFISEITLAELKFGVANSENKSKNMRVLESFINGINIIPIFNSLDLYAIEKARLKKIGKIIDEFDLLIGVTAVYNNMILVTNNIKHFQRIKNIKIEDWTR
jgi:tRNA(fMet)-specific endonuclease VapC